MKWKCPSCGRIHISKDNIKISICRGCLTAMEKLNEVENERTKII